MSQDQDQNQNPNQPPFNWKKPMDKDKDKDKALPMTATTMVSHEAKIRAILQATEIEALYLKRPVMATHLIELWNHYVIGEDSNMQLYVHNLYSVKLPKEFWPMAEGEQQRPT